MIDKFFETEFDRDLWLKLNAEHQIESDLNSKCSNAKYPRSFEEGIEIAKNQLAYDISINRLRFTIADYFILTYEERVIIRQKQFDELFKDFNLK